MPISIGQCQFLWLIAVALVILISKQDDCILFYDDGHDAKETKVMIWCSRFFETNGAPVPTATSPTLFPLLILKIDLYYDSLQLLISIQKIRALSVLWGSGRSQVIQVYHCTKCQLWYVEIFKEIGVDPQVNAHLEM